ncbi:MAG: flagellar biosynthesis protein FlhF, partial [Pseudomonadota bacterium]|nr:flagellar biosynthesis protein FlhF [Pseudomonadota bacterium]
MNVRRFTARTSRDALALVRQAFGDDAVVLSTKPSAGGVEVLAMAPENVAGRAEAALPETAVAEDVERLSMSTLSFQDHVRERMLKRRQEALNSQSRADVHADV